MKNYVVIHSNGVRTISAFNVTEAIQKFYRQVAGSKIQEVLPV